MCVRARKSVSQSVCLSVSLTLRSLHYKEVAVTLDNVFENSYRLPELLPGILCVCVCVCARARLCVRVCVRVSGARV